MATRRRMGATAAAALPAALAGALLVSAPFAGTTTAPLANSHNRAYVSAPAHHSAAKADSGIPISVSPGSLAMLAVSETMLVGVGVGVIVVTRRRRHAED